MNIMAEKRNIDNRKYKLIFDYKDQHKYFQDTYTYLSSFFESLWDQPSIIAKLITNSELVINLAITLGCSHKDSKKLER